MVCLLLSSSNSDYGCERRTLVPIGVAEVAGLIASVQYRLGNDVLKPMLPTHIEDAAHLDSLIKAAPEKLYVLYFGATWCGPCKALTPVYRLLSLRHPTSVFLKVLCGYFV
jgi:thiol-disulfide isomerase/thioredoxin